MLSTKPCCNDNDCSGKAAVKKELTNKTPAKEKECQDCSPFFSCGSCTGFIVAKLFSGNLNPAPENRDKCYTAFRQGYIQEISLSIWQPPKLG